MKIKTSKGIKEAQEVFPDLETFKDYVLKLDKNITAQEIWDRDKHKKLLPKKHGFDVLVIWDSEYRWGNKQVIIDKCLAF
jgi:hypothetical protein